MQTIELRIDEVRRYKDACDRDAMVERSTPSLVPREAYYMCHDFLRLRKLVGTPEKVTVTFRDGFSSNLYELHYSDAP